MNPEQSRRQKGMKGRRLAFQTLTMLGGFILGGVTGANGLIEGGQALDFNKNAFAERSHRSSLRGNAGEPSES